DYYCSSLGRSGSYIF
nr:immunoglobulin light chain junction region [Macaca mulatta]